MEAEPQQLGRVGQRLGLRPGGAEAQLGVEFEELLRHVGPAVQHLSQLGLHDERLLRGPGLAGGGEEEGGQEADQQQQADGGRHTSELRESTEEDRRLEEENTMNTLFTSVFNMKNRCRSIKDIL